MVRIRVHCRYCPATALVRPEQMLLVPWEGGGTYLFCCPACGRIADGPADPGQVLMLMAAGVPLVGGDHYVRRGQP